MRVRVHDNESVDRECGGDPLRAQIRNVGVRVYGWTLFPYESKESRDRPKVGRLPCNRIVPVTMIQR